MRKSDKLKPCPCCEKEWTYDELHWERQKPETHYLMCPECEAMTEDFATPEEAVDAWNRGEIIAD